MDGNQSDLAERHAKWIRYSHVAATKGRWNAECGGRMRSSLTQTIRRKIFMNLVAYSEHGTPKTADFIYMRLVPSWAESCDGEKTPA